MDFGPGHWECHISVLTLGTYIEPVLQHPWWPFSEFRTAGLPVFYLLSVSMAGSPVGILVAQNLLGLGACAAVTVAIRRYLRLGLASLVILVFLLFNPKEMSFEYRALTEHLSAMLYLLYAAAALATLRFPKSVRIAVTLGLLVLFNVLVKPSAVVLVVSTVILYAFHAWRERQNRIRYFTRVCGSFIAPVAGGLCLYVIAFRIQYGDYSMTHFGGYVAFGHAGQLVDLDSPKYAGIKRELRPLIESYRAKYVSRHEYLTDWLASGSGSPGTERDFGNRSPYAIIKAHVSNLPEQMQQQAMNRIFGDLAFEGIRAHPFEYLQLTRYGFVKLLRDGYSFLYYQYLPSAQVLYGNDPYASNLFNLSEWRKLLFGASGRAIPQTCREALLVRASAKWPLRPFLNGAVSGCRTRPDAFRRPNWPRRVDYVYWLLTQPMEQIFDQLPVLSLLGLIVMVIIGPRTERQRDVLIAAGFLALCCFGYLMFLALVNFTEPARFLANVQGLMMISMLLLTVGGLESIAVAAPQWARSIRPHPQ